MSTRRATASTLLCGAALLAAPAPARADMVCVTVTVTSSDVSETTGPFCSANTPFGGQYHVLDLEPLGVVTVTVEYFSP
jgi:hypothetical protein